MQVCIETLDKKDVNYPVAASLHNLAMLWLPGVRLSKVSHEYSISYVDVVQVGATSFAQNVLCMRSKARQRARKNTKLSVESPQLVKLGTLRQTM